MGYVIEICFDLYKHLDISHFQETLIHVAEKYTCSNHYFLFENYQNNDSKSRVYQEGTNYKSHLCIMNILFDSTSEDMVNCANCIQAIRKIPQCYIDSVYREEPSFQALYYSRHYLRSIDKNCRDIYDEKRRQRSYSETELLLIQAIEGKNHQPRKHAKTLTGEIRKHDNVSTKCTKVENELISKDSETDDLLEMYSPSPPRTFGEFLNLLENTEPSIDTCISRDGI
jgi:hypothetical protein